MRTIVAALVVMLAASFPSDAANGSDAVDLGWVRIAPGTFDMGCVPEDADCAGNEHPRHEVMISRPFEMMATEVTVGQFRAFARTTRRPPPTAPRFPQAEDHPVVNVRWGDAVAFCEWAGGRLPTEAEWEYAARGGQEGSIYPWGSEVSHERANYGADECCSGLASGRDQWVNTSPVGSFPPNGYGLFDMVGNVWEWVADWYEEAYYQQSPKIDPPGASVGSARVARGGSWLNFPLVLRTSLRLLFAPQGQTSNIGVRCARDVIRVRIARHLN